MPQHRGSSSDPQPTAYTIAARELGYRDAEVKLLVTTKATKPDVQVKRLVRRCADEREFAETTRDVLRALKAGRSPRAAGSGAFGGDGEVGEIGSTAERIVRVGALWSFAVTDLRPSARGRQVRPRVRAAGSRTAGQAWLEHGPDGCRPWKSKVRARTRSLCSSDRVPRTR